MDDFSSSDSAMLSDSSPNGEFIGGSQTITEIPKTEVQHSR